MADLLFPCHSERSEESAFVTFEDLRDSASLVAPQNDRLRVCFGKLLN